MTDRIVDSLVAAGASGLIATHQAERMSSVLIGAEAIHGG